MNIKKMLIVRKNNFILFLLLLSSVSAYGLNFPLPKKDQRFIGSWHYVTVKPGDTLGRIAFDHDVSVVDLLKYNPHIKEKSVIHPSERLLIPNCYPVPSLAPNHIVINLANQTLYYQPPDEQQLLIYPITIGKPSHPTPVGDFHIVRKKINPIWYPPISVRQANARRGVSLPRAIGPGPYNPLGRYALYLNKPTYLIHTAINGDALGGGKSFGCVRMYERDISELYPQIAIQTPVSIIDQPISTPEDLHKYCTN